MILRNSLTAAPINDTFSFINILSEKIKPVENDLYRLSLYLGIYYLPVIIRRISLSLFSASSGVKLLTSRFLISSRT